MNEMTQVLGIVAMEPKGEYDSSAYYEKLNIVTYNGSSYVALQNTRGNLPTNTNYWQLLAQKGAKTYQNVAEMKSDGDLKNGIVAETLGYYATNDGGGATYLITNVESQTEYQEELDNGLYATLIINDYVLPEQLGAKGDGVTDDLSILQHCANKFNKINGNSKIYYVSDNFISLNKNIEIKDLNIKAKSYNASTTEKNVPIFYLSNNYTVIFNNCKFESSLDQIPATNLLNNLNDGLSSNRYIIQENENNTSSTIVLNNCKSLNMSGILSYSNLEINNSKIEKCFMGIVTHNSNVIINNSLIDITLKGKGIYSHAFYCHSINSFEASNLTISESDDDYENGNCGNHLHFFSPGNTNYNGKIAYFNNLNINTHQVLAQTNSSSIEIKNSKIKCGIYISSQSNNTNIKFKDCELTLENVETAGTRLIQGLYAEFNNCILNLEKGRIFQQSGKIINSILTIPICQIGYQTSDNSQEYTIDNNIIYTNELSNIMPSYSKSYVSNNKFFIGTFGSRANITNAKGYFLNNIVYNPLSDNADVTTGTPADTTCPISYELINNTGYHKITKNIN